MFSRFIEISNRQIWSLITKVDLTQSCQSRRVLLESLGHLKLTDFGLARRCRIPERTLTHEVVTLWYRPPEVLLNALTYGMPLDIWGAGCVFAEMCLHRPLFRGECEIDQLLLIFR